MLHLEGKSVHVALTLEKAGVGQKVQVAVCTETRSCASVGKKATACDGTARR
jgi:hypothetical protein